LKFPLSRGLGGKNPARGILGWLGAREQQKKAGNGFI